MFDWHKNNLYNNLVSFVLHVLSIPSPNHAIFIPIFLIAETRQRLSSYQQRVNQASAVVLVC